MNRPQRYIPRPGSDREEICNALDAAVKEIEQRFIDAGYSPYNVKRAIRKWRGEHLNEGH